MTALIEFIGRALGLVVTGLVILSPVLIWLAKLMIEKIISHEFENEREVLRYQIATLLGRSTKIHDREFETLEAVWEKASISMGSAAGVLSLFQSSPDVTWLEEDKLEWVLSTCAIYDWQKDEVRKLTGRSRTTKLHNFLMESRRRTAWNDAHDFHNFVVVKGIFLKEEMNAKASALANLIFELLDEDRWASEDHNAENMRTKSEIAKRIREDGANLRDEVRAMIAARLWDVDFKEAG